MGLSILISGVGGQGTILTSRVFGRAAILEGRKVLIGEMFGSAQRGGPVTSHVKLGDGTYSPLLSARSADMLLAFEPIEALRRARFVKKEGIVIFNTKELWPTEVCIGSKKYPSNEQVVSLLGKVAKDVFCFDATAEAEKAGTARSANMAMAGAAFASGRLFFREQTLRDAIKMSVPPKTLEMNLKAFERGKAKFLER